MMARSTNKDSDNEQALISLDINKNIVKLPINLRFGAVTDQRQKIINNFNNTCVNFQNRSVIKPTQGFRNYLKIFKHKLKCYSNTHQPKIKYAKEMISESKSKTKISLNIANIFHS